MALPCQLVFTDERQYLMKALDLFKPGGRQRILEGRYFVQATPVVIEHTDALLRQNTVQARLPGDKRESWGQDIPLPSHIRLLTADQLDEAVKKFFDRWPDSLAPCPKCTQMTWNRQHFPSQYRDERCGDCWWDDFDRQIAVWAREAQDELHAQDVHQYHAGMRWRVSCVVHPPAGEYFIIDLYLPGKPTEAEALAEARKKYPRAFKIEVSNPTQLKDH
jgi:hypothetical protein